MKRLLTITCLLICSDLLGQSLSSDTIIRRSSIALNLGIRQVKDLNLHPKVHRGLSYGLGYSHYKQAEHIRLWEVDANFSGLKTSYEGAATSLYIQFLTAYSYNFSLVQDGPFSFYAGPQLAVQYSLGYYPNWDDSHLYWSSYLGLGLNSLLSYHTGGGTFLLKASLPLISAISRPEINRQHKIDDVSLSGTLQNMNSQWEAVSWNKSFAPTAGLEYLYPLSRKLSQSFGYSFQYLYLNASTGSPLYQLDHRLFLKIYF